MVCENGLVISTQEFSDLKIRHMGYTFEELQKQINIQYFETADDIEVLSNIHKRQPVTSIYFNIDFTPFAIKRDEKIIKWCQDNHIECRTFEDYTLLPVNTVTTNTNTYYSVFTPFYKKFLTLVNMIPSSYKKRLPKKVMFVEIQFGNVQPDEITKYYKLSNKMLFVKGGREEGLFLLERLKKKNNFTNYDQNRDYPSLDGTTRLSAYLKFGCVSIREVFEIIKSVHGLHHGLIRELIWRDFYANIAFNRPRVLNGQINKREGNLAFKEKYDDIKWTGNNDYFEKWCKGVTGFPIVDAAMRQLQTTGWMHNRCRMIVASFLIKDLLVDWRRGEQYFATQLVDYDPSSNSGGWQFCSSTGVDAQPYFRIFNPFTQSLKFDANAHYIKQWLPELQNIPAKDIHTWNTSHKKYIGQCQYPAPIVEHSAQTKKALSMYKQSL